MNMILRRVMSLRCVRKLLLVVVGVVACSPLSAEQSVPVEVVYPRTIHEQSAGENYPLALLLLALQPHSTEYVLRPSESPMLQGRALLSLEKGDELSVVWAMTGPTLMFLSRTS